MQMKAAALFLSLFLLAGCVPTPKIAFDVQSLDENGLQGENGAKRSLSYEYCVPNTPHWHSKINAIDPTAKFMETSPGRSGCRTKEILVMGDTHQQNFAEVLTKLSSFCEINMIRESHFE